jgi:hypothetical protein
LEGGARPDRDNGKRANRSPSQADRAKLNILRKRGGAHKFGERAAGLAAAHIHLEETVLRVHVALQEKQVMLVLRANMRNSIGVASNPSGSLHGGKLGGRTRRGILCYRDHSKEKTDKRARQKLGHD